MYGWNGKFLRVNLTTGEITTQTFDEEYGKKWIGGRGFAVKTLCDELEPGTDPLGPDNRLIFAAGLLSGLPIPSAGKMVVSAKSPITNGYADGNLGTWASENLRKAGYDALIVQGASDKPVMLEIKDDEVKIIDAAEYWGQNCDELHANLEEKYGKRAGVLTIGRGGENMVKYAIIRSLEGRAGGRPGVGAVMGSKKLKAVVITGTGEIPLADPEELKRLGREGLKDVKDKPLYDFWMTEGTNQVLTWCHETGTLPTFNFQEGTFDKHDMINGAYVGEHRSDTKGCPRCNMRCGHRVTAVGDDLDGRLTELDYENVGLLGPNLGIGDIHQIGTLNLLADEYGVDTISLGGSLGFFAEATQKGLVPNEEVVEWGDWQKFEKLIHQIGDRKGIGDLIADGTKRMAEEFSNNSIDWAIQVKGLECSAYNCTYVPGMALSFGVSPLGAHHKDAWCISFKLRESELGGYGEDKAAKVIELQRIRGGLFETFLACRFPWIEVGHSLDNYPPYLKAITGQDFSLDDAWEVADGVYALMRSFWIREYNAMGIEWSRDLDQPPARWFDDPQKEGPVAGKTLDRTKYQELLNHYYRLREWNHNGVPTPSLLKKLGLEDVIDEVVSLTGVTDNQIPEKK
ncbi:MAG: aldehyde ferredoxin oxidoreductase family protein [Candidatus Heimdallarchaeota archaeon]|nr:aldehyde ferredoxin oxidoreductase family protein [Candidatus Heimdallarchaeota archaeon]MCK5049381.1 aldehyde ferredoxin oxidoreductase family protein [Candidatus Heimdallarchaeota archaeon]